MKIWAVREVDIPHKTTGVLCLVVKGKKRDYPVECVNLSIKFTQLNSSWPTTNFEHRQRISP